MLNIDAVDFAIKNIRGDRNRKRERIKAFREIVIDESGKLKVEVLTEMFEATSSEKKTLTPEVKKVEQNINI